VRGINVKTNIVLGFPGQTRREVFATMRFLVSLALLGVRDTMVSLFSPYPGSETYRQLVAQGKLPAPNDEYFYSLLAYHNFASGRSWTDHVRGAELAIYRILGMLLFYTVSFARRPVRVIELLWHIATRRHESPLERGVVEFAQRALGRG
jgi:anaerobic magnesium-protoporphyrin IX monomethyl ester cyclase